MRRNLIKFKLVINLNQFFKNFQVYVRDVYQYKINVKEIKIKDIGEDRFYKI